MTTTIEIDTSKGILGMSKEEKDAFIDIMDLIYDYGFITTISEDDAKLYQAILRERHQTAILHPRKFWYPCEKCDTLLDGDNDIIWLTSSYGVCEACYNQMCDDEIQRIYIEYE